MTVMTHNVDLLCQEIVDGDGLYLSQAAQLMPTYREGLPTSPSTLHRWSQLGVKTRDGRTIVLETTRINGKLLTTKGALKRFFAAQATVPPGLARASPTETPV